MERRLRARSGSRVSHGTVESRIECLSAGQSAGAVTNGASDRSVSSRRRQVLPNARQPVQVNNKVEKRAAHDARTYTKVNTVRSHHKGGVNVDPSGAPQAS